jgi:glycosyltransferase involved in cell wall biosynthesis
MSSDPISLSVVVPFYNESENLPLLIAELDTALLPLTETVELILVNDGSTDRYERPVLSPHLTIRWLDLTENSGQSAALYYGMQAARGEWIALIDADLQNDPADLPRLWQEVREKQWDLITGIRQKRQDLWIRRISARIANAVRSWILQDHTTDTGCTLKILRREAAQRLPGWNGMHRFIPALVLTMGYQIGECPVHHRPRHAGVSKVAGGKRAWRATRDLLGMIWFSSRQFKGRLKS